MGASPPQDGIKILVTDIECIPMRAWVWGLRDQNIPISMIEEDPRIICFAAGWLGGKKKDIEFYAEWQKGGREAMLAEAWRLMDEADAIVGYNSKGFDIKWLKAELAVEGYTPPSPHKDIDLYTAVKSQFRFPSNKLDYVAQRFDLGAKTAHAGWSLWSDVIDGDPKAQKLMEKYNIQDVALTEKLHDHILPWIPNYPNIALFGDGEVGCRKCGGISFHKRGTVATATAVYQRVVCSDCGTWSRYATKEPDITSPYRPL
jgi:DNA polymerase elongation subunit (family B)